MLFMAHKPTESFSFFLKEERTIFSLFMGCKSLSSVAVGSKEIKKQSVSELADQESKPRINGEEKADEIKGRSLRAALEFPKLHISERLHSLMMRFKTLSHLFVYKEEFEEKEMEIGLPTDVKHVTHIGWDGSTTVNPVMGWENLKAPELLSFPSISLKQFDLAMSAQARGPPRIDSTSNSNF